MTTRTCIVGACALALGACAGGAPAPARGRLTPDATAAASAPPPAGSAPAAAAASASPKAEPPWPNEDECSVHHVRPGKRPLSGDDDSVHAAAPRRLAVDILGAEEQEKACERLRKHVAPTASADELPECFVRAHGGDRGVWTIAVHRSDKPRGSWSLVHSALDGRNVSGPRVPFSESALDVQIAAITDYGADASPEVVSLDFTGADSAGGSAAHFSIWTLKRGKIEPYTRQGKVSIVDLVDHDGDELPDLVIDPHGVQVGGTSGWSKGLRSWSVLAHATKDGTFSLTDSVAQDFARSLCPRSPDLARALKADESCYPTVAHCARLWGHDERAVDQALASACKAAGPTSLCATSLDAFRAIAATKPPFVLGPKAP